MHYTIISFHISLTCLTCHFIIIRLYYFVRIEQDKQTADNDHLKSP